VIKKHAYIVLHRVKSHMGWNPKRYNPTASRGTQSRYKNKVNLKYLRMYNVIIKHKLCLNFLIPFSQNKRGGTGF